MQIQVTYDDVCIIHRLIQKGLPDTYICVCSVQVDPACINFLTNNCLKNTMLVLYRQLKNMNDILSDLCRTIN